MILKPARFAVSLWSVFITFTALLYPQSFLTLTSILAIGIGLGVFAIGVRLGTSRRRDRPRIEIETGGRMLMLTVLVGSAANVLAGFMAMTANGFGISRLFSSQGLFEVANTLATARYGGDVYSTPFSSFLLCLGYTAALCAPFAIRGRGKKASLSIVFAPMVTSIMYAAVTTERLGLLTSVSLTGGAWIASHVHQKGEVPKLSFKIVFYGLIGALVVGASFTAIAFLRAGSADGTVTTKVWAKQVTYVAGSLPAFSQWYDGYLRASDPLPTGFGSASLAGVESLVGRDRKSYRAYDQFTVIDTSDRQTNVYTIFRGLILDFTEPGALLVLLGLGTLFGSSYRSARAGSPTGAIGLASGYGIIAMSPTVAITTFTNVLVAMLLAAVLMKITSSSSSAKDDLERQDLISMP